MEALYVLAAVVAVAVGFWLLRRKSLRDDAARAACMSIVAKDIAELPLRVEKRARRVGKHASFAASYGPDRARGDQPWPEPVPSWVAPPPSPSD
jgi:hypothetical protein